MTHPVLPTPASPAPQRLAITVPGEPVPQGSTKAYIPKGWRRPIITGDNPRTKIWRGDVQGATLVAQRTTTTWPTLSTKPIRVDVDFVFLRPASVSATRRPHVTVKPDLDKTCRALLDALTGFLWRDDAQVVSLTATKAYAEPGEPAHTLIHVEEIA